MEDRGRNIGRDAEGRGFIDPMMRGVVPEITEKNLNPTKPHHNNYPEDAQESCLNTGRYGEGNSFIDPMMRAAVPEITNEGSHPEEEGVQDV